MTLSRDEAWTHLTSWTETDSLRKHARAVEIALRAAAEAHGGDVEEWGVAGMLHDADYERWPEEHPARIVAWLREREKSASPTPSRRTTPSGASATTRRSTRRCSPVTS